jgi:membrane protein DedA with SNARE-associated domain
MRTSARFALVVIIALLIPILPFAVVGELPGERWLSAADSNALSFGAVGGGLLAADVLIPVPSSIIGSLLGARLGLVAGFLWAWGGLMLGNLIGYAAGRLLLARLARGLPEAPTALVLFASRPVPVLAEAVTFTAGAGRMPLAHFLAVAAAGNALYAGALAGNGAALLPDALAGPGLVLPMLLPVVAWLVWRRLARQPAAETE